jgi:hypothetical protein
MSLQYICSPGCDLKPEPYQNEAAMLSIIPQRSLRIICNLSYTSLPSIIYLQKGLRLVYYLFPTRRSN